MASNLTQLERFGFSVCRSADPAIFWGKGSPADDVIGEVQIPPVSAALPKRLGNFPFWRGEKRFLDALELLYRQASQRGLEVVLGERAQHVGEAHR